MLLPWNFTTSLAKHHHTCLNQISHFSCQATVWRQCSQFVSAWWLVTVQNDAMFHTHVLWLSFCCGEANKPRWLWWWGIRWQFSSSWLMQHKTDVSADDSSSSSVMDGVCWPGSRCNCYWWCHIKMDVSADDSSSSSVVDAVSWPESWLLLMMSRKNGCFSGWLQFLIGCGCCGKTVPSP